MGTDPASARLEDLIEHREHLDAATPLATAQAEFARRHRRFLGVTEGDAFIGIASGREIAEVLSSQFGHALFGRAPVSQHVMKEALVVTPDLPLTELLKLTAARSERAFYHDIALVGAKREFLGLIPVHRLARLQTTLLLDNLIAVEAQRRELASRNRRMEADLRMAREVQLAMLPSHASRVVASGKVVDASHVYEPAELIGGDFLATFSPAPGCLACCICDVMGHGVRSALITAILRALIEEDRERASDPGDVLTRLDRKLQSVLRSVGDGLFVTAACAVIDLERGELRYSQAGHPPPLLWKAGGATAAELALPPEAAGPALGILDDFRFATYVTPFSPGDGLLLFTDGVTEVTSDEGEEFGVERLCDAFRDALAENRADVVHDVVEAARHHAASNTFPDDVCLLLLRCAEESRRKAAAPFSAAPASPARETPRPP